MFGPFADSVLLIWGLHLFVCLSERVLYCRASGSTAEAAFWNPRQPLS